MRVRLEHSVAQLPGMMNIGVRPTFGGQAQTLEVHIFDFEDNLYGRQVMVSFVQRIRSERKFDNLLQLTEQLKADRAKAAELLGLKEL